MLFFPNSSWVCGCSTGQNMQAYFSWGLYQPFTHTVISQCLSREKEPVEDAYEEMYCKNLAYTIVGTGKASQRALQEEQLVPVGMS